jgi:hypothetical protein
MDAVSFDKKSGFVRLTSFYNSKSLPDLFSRSKILRTGTRNSL